MAKHWTTALTHFFANRRIRLVLMTLYYIAIIVGLMIMYRHGNFQSAPFIYQGF